MPSGRPIKEEERRYVFEHKETESYRYMGKILGLSPMTIKKIAEGG